MNPTRRGILIGSAISLLFLSGISLEQIDPKVEDYYTEEGRFNIWQVQNNQWKMMMDSSGHPLEFSSREEADDFCSFHNLRKQPQELVMMKNFETGEDEERLVNVLWDEIPDKESLTIVRPAPTEKHPVETINLSAEEADTLISDWNLTNIQANFTRRLLMSKDGADQSKVWLEVLMNHKREAYPLQHHPKFVSLIRSIYCSATYHATLAKLTCFCPLA